MVDGRSSAGSLSAGGSGSHVWLIAVVAAAVAGTAWWWANAPGVGARPRVAVVRFDPPPAGHDLWSAADLQALHDAVITTLVDGGAVDVLERDAVMRIFTEQGMDSAAHATPAAAARAGRVLQADYVVLGTIAEAEQRVLEEETGYDAGPERTGRLHAGIDLRVVEVETSRIVGAGRAELDDAVRAHDDDTALADRRAQFSRRVAMRVAERVVDAAVPAAIHSVHGDNVELTRGSTAGVAVGDRFAVSAAGRRPGAAAPVAEIEIVRVEPTRAIARLVSESASVAPGDVCTLVARRPGPPPLMRADPLAERW